MDKYFEIQRVIINQFKKEAFYQRKIFETMPIKNRLTGIMGGRGVGKTTYLLSEAIKAGAEEKKALYISADNIHFLNQTLFDFVGELFEKTEVKLLCIDEIHKYENWIQELKNIYDTYNEIRVAFSSSSMFNLTHAKYDLSRRVTLHTLHGFSFREYLEFYHDQELPCLSLDEILNNNSSLINIDKVLMHFQEYLKFGYYPFFREIEGDVDKYQAIENIIQKTIYEDIAIFHNLKTPTLILLEKLYKYIITSSPGELNISKLASAVSKDFKNVLTNLNMLQQAGLIRFVHAKKHGKAVLKSPKKILPDNSCFIFTSYLEGISDSMIGKVREAFFLNQTENTNLDVIVAENGDYKINQYTFEIGGKNKTQKQIKNIDNAYLVVDDTVSLSKNKIPLWLFGLLY